MKYYYLMNNKLRNPIKISLLFISLFLGNSLLFAQLRIDSPYSRFGLGDINNGYNAYQSSMGGTGYGVIDPLRISTLNPASYAFIDSSSFVFNAAFDGMGLRTYTQTQSGSSSYFNLNYLKMATPITRWWKLSFGFMPFSTMGYNVNTYNTLDSIGKVRYGYLGDGGITRIYLGNAFKINKHLSVGINTSYLFGNLNLRRETEMQDIITAFKYRLTNTVTVKALYLDYGIQYQNKFKIEKLNQEFVYGLGLTYANGQNLNGSYNAFGFTYTTGNEGYEYIKDTIVNEEKSSGKISIPQKIGGGFSIGQAQKWMVAADFTFDEWSKFTAFGQSDSLQNSTHFNLGGQYQIKNWKINVGYRFNNSYLYLNNTQIKEYGISFGVSIPITQKVDPPTSSFIDLGFEYGRRGTTENNLIMQEFYKVKIGINIKNTWFQRTKYL